MKITYTVGIKVPAGWRSVDVVAEATKITEKMAVVTEVTTIDGEEPSTCQSRTGASRQSFNGFFWAGLQVGTRKRLSACKILD